MLSKVLPVERQPMRDTVISSSLLVTIARNRALTWDIRASRGAIYPLPPETLSVVFDVARAMLVPCSVLRGRARRYLDSGCQPVVAKADGLFRKSTAGAKKPLQKRRILCSAAVALEVHTIEKHEP